MKNPERGEIWLMDWSPGRGSEQLGKRPSLIIQTDAANRNPGYPNVIIAAMTSRIRGVPTHVQVVPTKENGLTELSEIMAEQIQTASKERLVKRLGKLDDATMRKVEHPVRLALSMA